MSNQYSTPDLPYPYDALEPNIDKETMKIHHDKHHVKYTSKLNEAINKHSEFFDTPPDKLLQNLDVIPQDIRDAVRNHGGGHVNHSLFWEIMSPDGGGEPGGILAEALTNEFGSVDEFRNKYEKTAANLFGSGWAWLVISKNGKLEITQTQNQDTPLSFGKKPLLLLDLWEHSYYLKYQNKRPEYIKAWWNVVNWDAIQKSYQDFQKI